MSSTTAADCHSVRTAAVAATATATAAITNASKPTEKLLLEQASTLAGKINRLVKRQVMLQRKESEARLLNDIARLAGEINKHKRKMADDGPTRLQTTKKRKLSNPTQSHRDYSTSLKSNALSSITPIDATSALSTKTSPSSLRRSFSATSSSLSTNGPKKPTRRQFSSAKSELCLFFTKYGKCNNSTACPYVHDPTKVSICSVFLRQGKCSDPHCLLQHTLSHLQNRMPVCHHFLKGMCTNDACPYTHVKVNDKAAVCKDFLKGYCPRGPTCRLKHIVVRKGERGKEGEGNTKGAQESDGDTEVDESVLDDLLLERTEDVSLESCLAERNATKVEEQNDVIEKLLLLGGGASTAVVAAGGADEARKLKREPSVKIKPVFCSANHVNK